MKDIAPQYLDTPSGRRIAYHQTKGDNPGILFLGGFKSDMTGTKACYLEQWARNQNQAYIRFDYSGHGQSSESFEDGTIGSWLEDTQQVLSQLTQGPQLLVGSSMGGWLSLLLARANPDRIKGIVTIACATDFTEKLLIPSLSEQQLETVTQLGKIEVPSEYDQQPVVISQVLLTEGHGHLLLNSTINIRCPIHMIHGLADEDVPWDISLQTLQQVETNNVSLELVKDGDHRLSKPTDLERISEALKRWL